MLHEHPATPCFIVNLNEMLIAKTYDCDAGSRCARFMNLIFNGMPAMA